MPSAARDRRRRRAAAVAIGLALAVGVVARFVTVSHLWLDEALTVNIARLPLGDMFRGPPPRRGAAALLPAPPRLDGHGRHRRRGRPGPVRAVRRWRRCRSWGWPGAGWWGRRHDAADDPSPPGGWRGRRCCCWRRRRSPSTTPPRPGCTRWSCCWSWPASSPSTPSCHRRRGGRASVLGLATGLLLLTHYWAFFLVAAVAGLLGAPVAASRGARRALLAMGLGSLLFVPWLPSFLDQMRTTGTPWGTPPKPRAVFDIVMQFGAGLSDTALPLGLLLYALLALGLFGAAAGRRRPDRHPRPPGPAAGADAGRGRRSHHGPGRGRRPDHRVRLRHPLRGGGVPPGAPAGRPGLRHPGRHLAGPGGVGPGRRPRLRHRHPQRRRRPHVGGTGGRRPPGRGPPGRRGRLLPRPARTAGEPPARGDNPALRQLTFPRATPPQLVDWVDYLAANRAPAGALRPHARRPGRSRRAPSGWCGRPTTAPSAPGARACSPTSAPLRPDERRVVKVSTNTLERPGLVQYPARVGCGPWLIRIRNSTSSSSGPARPGSPRPGSWPRRASRPPCWRPTRWSAASPAPPSGTGGASTSAATASSPRSRRWRTCGTRSWRTTSSSPGPG